MRESERVRRKEKYPHFLPILLVIIGASLVVFSMWWLLSGQNRGAFVENTPVVENSYPEIQRVTLADAKAAYDAKQAVFVDVRGDALYAQAHIPGAISVPLTSIEQGNISLNQNDWIITYCT